MSRDEAILRIVGRAAPAASHPGWWPTSTSHAPMDEILEAHRRLRVLARMMIDDAARDVLIKDAEIRSAPRNRRAELVERRVTAWDWFTVPWHGIVPRLSLDECCSVLPFDARWIRARVREAACQPRWSLPGRWHEQMFDEHRHDRLRRKEDEPAVPPEREAEAARLVSSFSPVAAADGEFAFLVRSARDLLKSA